MTRPAILNLPSAILAFITVAGCTVGPDYRAPHLDVPDSFGSWTGGAVGQGVDLNRWWIALNDPALDALIDQSIAGNLDLREAEARLREARAQRGVVAADRFPGVNATGSYRRSKTSENAFSVGGGGDSGAGTSDSAFSFQRPGDTTDLFQAGFDASWELDLFGGVRRAVEAADADLDAVYENRRNVLATLVAEVARNYAELRGYQRQIGIAERNVKIQIDAADVARAKARLAGGSELEVARAEAQTAQTRSQIPLLEQQRDAAAHRLAILTGRPPRALFDSLTAAKTEAIPSGPPVVAPGLPAELLRRRPDVRRAERELAAATARVGEATADLYPRFTLTGAVGLQSETVRHLTDWKSHFWNFGPSFSWPIFDAGRIRSNVSVQESRTAQADARYRKAVLTALEEVENALTAYSKEQSRRTQLTEAVARNRRAVELANTLYQGGARDFLNVIDAQRALLVTEDALAQSDRTVTTNLVALFKALGCGAGH
ncbi:MAG TPA: efflux transporter outer membrane subunit [Tepidisphaeraceae bacterium]|nr:efflux transporter outer membrane subunit [Tepidisphaeraceae bacterium]